MLSRLETPRYIYEQINLPMKSQYAWWKYNWDWRKSKWNKSDWSSHIAAIDKAISTVILKRTSDATFVPKGTLLFHGSTETAFFGFGETKRVKKPIYFGVDPHIAIWNANEQNLRKSKGKKTGSLFVFELKEDLEVFHVKGFKWAAHEHKMCKKTACIHVQSIAKTRNVGDLFEELGVEVTIPWNDARDKLEHIDTLNIDLGLLEKNMKTYTRDWNPLKAISER